MPGITRIHIKSDWNDWRTKISRDHEWIADNLYRHIFDLEDGLKIETVKKEEAIARYDWQQGIDVILTRKDGSKATIQEKFLQFRDCTVTFETKKSSGEPGVWFYCTAQYYFVGYLIPEIKNYEFRDYILLNLPKFHDVDNKSRLPWLFKKNKKDNRRANFKYINFNDTPVCCVVARKNPTNLTPPSAAVRSTTQIITQQSLFQEANHA